MNYYSPPLRVEEGSENQNIPRNTLHLDPCMEKQEVRLSVSGASRWKGTGHLWVFLRASSKPSHDTFLLQASCSRQSMTLRHKTALTGKVGAEPKAWLALPCWPACDTWRGWPFPPQHSTFKVILLTSKLLPPTHPLIEGLEQQSLDHSDFTPPLSSFPVSSLRFHFPVFASKIRFTILDS